MSYAILMAVYSFLIFVGAGTFMQIDHSAMFHKFLTGLGRSLLESFSLLSNQFGWGYMWNFINGCKWSQSSIVVTGY